MNEGLVNYKKGQGGFIAQPLSTSLLVTSPILLDFPKRLIRH